jgi:hypothetical protein
LVVVCCVLCVVVVTSFSYLTSRKPKIGPAKMADFSALITKNASLDAPIIKVCPKLPSSLDLGHFFDNLARPIGGNATNAEKVCYFYLGRVPSIFFSFIKSDFP